MFYRSKGNTQRARFLVLVLALCLAAAGLSCSSPPTNLRMLAPGDALIYLETNDLASVVQPIVDNDAFAKVAKDKPNLSGLRGIQMAVVVTGFETSEDKIEEDSSIGRVQPHFAAIADTHAWGWQTRSFAENQLGEFINNVYGGGVSLDTRPENGGTSYVWTADDGRKAFAFVEGSMIYFGNDRSAIDKCLAVRRGEGESLASNPKIPQAEAGTVAFGYVTPDGISQIAGILGITMASQTGEEENVKSFIAGVLPQLLRSSVSDLTWTAATTDQGVEDRYIISTSPEVSAALNDSMQAGADPPDEVLRSMVAKLPSEYSSVTRYNLKDPQAAWQSVLGMAQKQTDAVSGKILVQFASLLFEPYGIRDPQAFLNSIGDAKLGRNLITAKLDAEGEKLMVIATRGSKEAEQLKSLSAEMKPPKSVTEGGRNVWTAATGDLEAIFLGDSVAIGSADTLSAPASGVSDAASPFNKLLVSKAPISTLGRDADSAAQIALTFGTQKSDTKVTTFYQTETKFTRNGIERRTVSAFGLVGAIVAQLAPEE